jgi:hypothetical protein
MARDPKNSQNKMIIKWFTGSYSITKIMGCIDKLSKQNRPYALKIQTDCQNMIGIEWSIVKTSTTKVPLF